MGEECIHGFDEGLCAICSPPPEPDPAVAAARSRQLRAPGTSHAAAAAAEARAANVRASGRAPASGRPARPTGGTRTGRAGAGVGEAPVDAAATRIYHVTHIDNLGRILGAGALLADAGDPPAEPVVELAAPAARAFRRSATVGASGATVAEYVPFLLSTDAHVWESIRTGTPDPRLSAEAVGRPIADHVILVTSVAAAAGPRRDAGGLVVSETDAAVGGGVSADTWAEAERTLVRLTLADEGAGLRAAEVLVRGSVPFERIALVAVANDRVRDRVRAALQAVGSKTRVAVYPPWFQATGE